MYIELLCVGVFLVFGWCFHAKDLFEGGLMLMQVIIFHNV